MPPKTYFICATPRSGSYLLSYGMTRTGLAGKPDEYFQVRDFFTWTERLGIRAGTFTDYVEGLIAARTVNEVFGAKIMWDHMVDCFSVYLNTIPALAGKPRHEQMARLFHDPRYVFIQRRDKVRQAVSMVRALQTQIWQVWVDIFEPAQQPAQQPTFDYDWIEREFWSLTTAEQGWRDFFAAAGIEPLTLVYEDFAPRFEETVTAALHHLQIELPADYVPPTPTIHKQSDDLNDQWVEQYHAEQERRRAAAGALAALQAENHAFQTQIDGMLTELNALQHEHHGLRRAVDLARADYAALQADYDSLDSQHQALVREVNALRDLPPPMLELAARRLYRGLVPAPVRLKLRDLRTRR